MRVKEIMSTNPTCCGPETNLREVAEQMVTCDCGEIPVCDPQKHPVGVVTDRDIVCRLVAKGHNPLEARAEDCMSTPVVTTTPDADIEESAQLMKKYQIRRLPVVDERGAIVGMVAQADVVRRGSEHTGAEVVGKVSEPSTFASSVGGR